MIQFVTPPKNERMNQIVEAALSSLAIPQQEPVAKTQLTIPEELQRIIYQPGLVLLSGRPSMGCTSLALNTALSIAKIQRRTVLYFSFDDTKEMLMKKLLCIEGMVNTKRIWDREFTDGDWIRLATAGKLIKELPLYIYDDPLLTVGEISQICRQHKCVDLVIIDFLQSVQSMPGEWNTSKRTKKENRILQQLNRLSREHNTTVLCLNTLGRDVERRVCKEPDVCDIRKYRKSFDYIDTALFLYRQGYYEDVSPEELVAYCYVRLNRNNDSWRICMRWVPEYTTFLDVPFRHAE